MYVEHGGCALRQLPDHGGNRGFAAALRQPDRLHTHGLVHHLANLVEAPAHHAQVVFDDARAAVAELVGKLSADGFQQPLFGEIRTPQQRGRRKERALEGDALRRQAQVGVGGLLAGDFEGVEIVQPDVFIGDHLLVALRDSGPDAVGVAGVALDHENTALAQSRQRIVCCRTLGSGARPRRRSGTRS
ncbi:MAG: hypothetical protein U5K56_13355 [Halioglobus sp.]|nr:hypothetical protein [Halioglobus sp.]